MIVKSSEAEYISLQSFWTQQFDLHDCSKQASTWCDKHQMQSSLSTVFRNPTPTQPTEWRQRCQLTVTEATQVGKVRAGVV